MSKEGNMAQVQVLAVKLTALVGLCLLAVFPVKAYAEAEAVYVAKIMQDVDKAIIVRNNGETYLIEKGNGCDSFERYEKSRVVIVSFGTFSSVGSSLLLPASDEECRIWRAEKIGSCMAVHWILNILGDGKVIVLEDNSFWRVASAEAGYSNLWFPKDQVMVCGNAMVNTSTGEKVRVKRFR